MNALYIILGVSLLLNAYLWWLHFKGTDKDKDGIDDRLEVKAKRVKKEIKDVKKAFKK
jgi:hypothetical protein